MIYTDYKGNEASPNKDSIVKYRSGIWAAIIDPENRVLVSRPNFDLHSVELPGGGIDEGEEKEQSLLREIEEETGVVFKHLDIEQTDIRHFKYYARDVNEFWDYDQEHWIVRLKDTSHYFEGQKSTEEGAFGEWMSLDSISENNFHHSRLVVLKDIGIL